MSMMWRKNCFILTGILLAAFTVPQVHAEAGTVSPDQMSGRYEGTENAAPAITALHEQPRALGGFFQNLIEFFSGKSEDKDTSVLKINMVQEYSENNSMYATGEYPDISLAEEEAGDYEELAKALTEYTDTLRTNTYMTVSELQSLNSRDASDGGSYYSNTSAWVMRADSLAVSILLMTVYDGGGTHPSRVYSAVTFDAATGKKLSLEDVLQDQEEDDLPDLLEDGLLENYSRDMFIVEDLSGTIREKMGKSTDGIGGSSEELVWTLGYDGLNFYFSPADLASSAAGAQSVTLAYEEEPDLAEGAYTDAPNAYIQPVFSNEYDNDVTIPLPRTDGDTLRVEYSPTGTEDAAYGNYTIAVSLNSNTWIENIYGYNFRQYLVHSGSQNWLYFQYESDGASVGMDVYDLNGNSVSAPQHVFESGGQRWFRSEAPTDPDDMELETFVQMLSSNPAWRPYSLGSDGMPVAKQDFDYYEDSEAFGKANGTPGLTVKTSFEAQVRTSEDGNGTTQTLSPGTRLYFYATNAIAEASAGSWVDFKDTSGRFVRISIQGTAPDLTIDGTSAEDLLDGITYAGGW